MGEYAIHGGQRIKIGTCEDMYYLRADQRNLVTGEPGSLNPATEYKEAVRFRFPFPDEDENQPGGFAVYNRALWIPGLKSPDGVTHHNVQFARNGYVLSVPCPESAEVPGISRNGFPGAVGISQQRWIDGEWWTVCECFGCGSKWRLDYDEAELVAVKLRGMADKNPGDARSGFYHTVADRILAGYTKHPAETLNA